MYWYGCCLNIIFTPINWMRSVCYFLFLSHLTLCLRVVNLLLMQRIPILFRRKSKENFLEGCYIFFPLKWKVGWDAFMFIFLWFSWLPCLRGECVCVCSGWNMEIKIILWFTFSRIKINSQAVAWGIAVEELIFLIFKFSLCFPYLS